MSTPIEQFRVLKVDNDGSVELENLDMVARGVRNARVWADCETPLEVGSTVRGSFDTDPRDSLVLLALPTFTVVPESPAT